MSQKTKALLATAVSALLLASIPAVALGLRDGDATPVACSQGGSGTGGCVG